MELRVLGPMEVVAGSRPVDLGPRMHRAVLSLLVMELDRVVSVDRLTDCLWGDDPPPTATSALQVYVSGLRKALDPDRAPGAASRVLVTQAPGYVLRIPRHAIDAFRFEALAAEGRALLDSQRPAAAYDVLGLGLGLWRGSPYQDLEFESFLQAEIARLNDLRATAAEARAEALLALGRHSDAVADAERLVAEEPLRERRWGLLALALYRDGRQGDALRALSRARRTLGEELGLDLGPDLCRLEHDILEHRPSLDWQPPLDRRPSTVRRVPLLHGVDVGSMLASSVGPLATRLPETGPVMPADECPHGFSLGEVAAAVSSFQLNGNDPKYLPDTPFQILHLQDVNVEIVGGGMLGTGDRSFTVAAGTVCFVPIWVIDDRPPVTPGFPSTASSAAAWFFDPAHSGGRDFQIVVDGRSTPIGAEYVTGPAPIVGDEQHHAITLAAFLRPLNPGTHVVIVRGGVFGRGAAEAHRISFMQEELTYTVEVLPAS
ncbi:MAG TPA: BTAD domain-containing putative transcriptional regulator [Acidimicrobiales bacterium]|nr:BTAD domain-containing putative transcriptional regulator [Acidimicrobiales bacterium]